MKYLFYEHGELVAELDKCTVVSAADDAGVSTVLFNGKTYQRRKPVEFVQEWVAFDLVNKWAPSSFQSFAEVNKAAAGWFDKVPKGLTADAKPSYPFKGLEYHVGNAAEFWMKECRRWQATFEELESDVEHLRNDKIVANGLIANLEGLAAADGEKINRLEVELAAVKIERDTLRQAGDNALAKIDQLRNQRDSVLAQVESYEVDGVHSGCASEIGRLSLEVKDRDVLVAALQKDLAKCSDQRKRDRERAATAEHNWKALSNKLSKISLVINE